ncbi:YcnI family protein [Roseomonas alkaliterrae]|nr:YcnI family protein [Neoroseomonas alkaliterrae]MBR0678713.1 YcnI family protein [Neoroseomonas alkaliterrae]
MPAVPCLRKREASHVPHHLRAPAPPRRARPAFRVCRPRARRAGARHARGGPHHPGPPQAAPNAITRATLRVPHGCGDAATIRIQVRIPEGVTAARPMPKPGWTLVLTPREGAPAPAGHGAVPELAAITWEGGRLPNEHYDEFVLRFRTPDRANETLWFAVRQDCEGGRSVDWAQVPAEGRRLSDYPTPAASLRLVPR